MEDDEVIITETQGNALRDRVKAIRENRPGVFAKDVYSLLQAEKEKGQWEWVSMNRIKKMFTKLNRQEEQQQKAGIKPGMPMRCVVSRLPAWPKSDPMYNQFQYKLLDSASEKSRPIDSDPAGLSTDEVQPGNEPVSFRIFRPFVCSLMQAYEAGPLDYPIVLNDNARSEGIMLIVTSIRRSQRGWPVFMLQYYAANSQSQRTEMEGLLQWATQRSSSKSANLVHCSLEEQELWRTILGVNETTLAKSCENHSDSASVTKPLYRRLRASFIAAEEFRVEGGKDGKSSPNTCGFCAGTAVKMKQCAGCQGIKYWSSQCQKQHWKQHKATCLLTMKTGERDSVVISVAPPPELSYNQTMGVNGTSRVHRKPCDAVPKNSHSDKPFIIKAQVAQNQGPKGGAMALIYDKARKLHRPVMEGEPGVRQIQRVVQEKGFLGLKAYLWAQREGPDLRVYVSGDLPPQKQSW